MAEPQYGERVEFGPNDVCYRHADRPSLTLCQRCGNTICPECQTVSAVGVLCPACVREARGSSSQRAARSSRVAARRFADPELPIVTYAIMALCVGIFLAQLLSSSLGDNGVTEALWYAPAFSLPDAAAVGFVGVTFEPWRMITAVFTHSTSFLFHILFNLFALWLFGRQLEQILGRAAFLVLYLFAGWGGSLMVMLWVYADPASIRIPTVGASGAIFGVLAAMFVAYRAARVNVTSLAVLIGINLAIGFIPGASISWQAHLGGILVGGATAAVLLATRGPRKRQARLWSLIGMGAVLLLLSGLYWVAPPPIPWLL